ncbi:hypothetical protein CHCC14819_2654 [Bacillus licheniformis]|nr:hypothetical protein CHCC14819_2654 [Bacillus licheniformis]TWM96245.1 hypothetical protein CHCC14566_0020 [Bacillus licheniformis]
MKQPALPTLSRRFFASDESTSVRRTTKQITCNRLTASVYFF